jgi:hypothetical protein
MLGAKFSDGIEVVRSQAQAAARLTPLSPKFGDSSFVDPFRTRSRLRSYCE